MPLVVVLFAVTARAQDLEPLTLYAATLRIIYPGVEVRLANTERWIELPGGAQTALGEGDTVRTDLNGRALLAFDTGGRALILPATVYLIGFYSAETINVQIMGRSIAQIPAAAARYSVNGFTEVRTNGTADATFAIATRPAAALPLLDPLNARPPVVYAIAATDGVEIAHPNGALPLPAGYGVALDALMTTLTPIPLSAPYRFSDLEVATSRRVCAATATPTTAPRLLARIGASESFQSLGAFDFGAPLQIVGRTENGRRYRSAYFSAFAWVVADGVTFAGACDVDTLSVYPSTTAEQPLGAVAVTAEELELLQPFYGTPDDDPWFYRATNDLTP